MYTGGVETEFFCLCMSPALDATVTLPAWPSDGDVCKDVAETVSPGGKGLNVARWLAGRGARVTCGGLLGADNAVPFESELARGGIADAFVRVPGETRRNEMIVTPQGSFKLNRPAFPGLGAGFDAAAVLKAVPARAGVAVLSGSLPPAVPKTFYADAVRALKARGWTVVLDASGAALQAGIEAGPDVIKPNAEECAALVGFVPASPADFARATSALRAKAGTVIISDGAAGAWFDGAFVAAPQVTAFDTTAAGDTLLAEYCWRRFGCGDAEAARWAVAAGSAAVLMPGGTLPPAERVSELKGQMK